MSATSTAQKEPDTPTVSDDNGLDQCRAIPLVLGVTGHRDLREQDLPQLKALVCSIFAELHERYPQTPLVLLSPLAAGADRFVAEWALERGLKLIVPLSWPHDICAELLYRTGSRNEFDALLQKAEQHFNLPLLEGVHPDDLRDSEAARDRQYEQLGAYIARHSQILIALWDGEDATESGTARVIRWQEQGELAPYAPSLGRLDELENGPVYHVTTPRSEHPSCVECVELIKRYPVGYSSDEAAAVAFDHLWRQINQFNADAFSKQGMLDPQLLQSRDWVFPEQEREKLPEPMAELLECYARADATSMRFQSHTKHTLWGLFGLVAAAVFCFELYAHLLVEYWQLLVTYLCLLLASVAWYRWATTQHHHAKYLDYRALAESLRVQFFWRLAGVDESVTDHYLRNLRSELDWIRQAVRSYNLTTGLHSRQGGWPNDDILSRLKLVRKYWVTDQLKYFNKSAPKNELAHHCWARRSAICFWLAIALALLLLVTHISTHHLNHVLVVLVFCSVAAAALCHEYGEKQAYSVQAKRYEWMRSLFATADRHLESLIKSGKSEETQHLVRELGIEALQENADWLLQRRQRPIKPPTV